MERIHGFLDDQVAARPDKPAFSDSTGADWSYADLGRAVDALQRILETSDVHPGDRVVILCENCCALVAAIFATSRAGATIVPLNARLTASEIDRLIAHIEPAVILATDHVSADAARHAERLGATPISGAFGSLSLVRWHGAPDEDLDVAAQLYTTGTTGTPKGVMLTHGNIRFGGETSAYLRKMVPEDVIYGVLPISHVFGFTSILMGAVGRGASVRLAPRFTAERLYQALTNGITLLSAVPQMHALLMQYTREQGYDRLPSTTLRFVSSGAAPLDPVWKRKAEAFYGVAIQNGYGLTETSAGTCATQNNIGDPDISVGPPLPGTDLKIDHDAPGAQDGVGEILVRGPNVMKGYYKNPEATAEVLGADGWFRTGDLGRVDDKGHLHILGRAKELIIHGGFNIYPPEVEAALNEHPSIIQAAVVGRPVAGDELVYAFCQVSESDLPDVDALRAFAAERLTGYKRPSRIILANALPAAPSGKILKHRLLDHFADQLDG